MARNARTTDATATSPASATMTITITPTTPETNDNESNGEQKVLKLKLKNRTSRHITWSEDTIDNEDMNKKKSNRTKSKILFCFIKTVFVVCCIFHPNEAEDHDCDHGREEEEIPAGKNVYEFQPNYKKCNKP